MTEVKNITIPPDEWVNVNTLVGIVVGTEMLVQNDGVSWVRLQESTTQPVAETEGKLLTNLKDSTANGSVDAGSDDLWARSTRKGVSGSLAVQEVV